MQTKRSRKAGSACGTLHCVAALLVLALAGLAAPRPTRAQAAAPPPEVVDTSPDVAASSEPSAERARALSDDTSLPDVLDRASEAALFRPFASDLRVAFSEVLADPDNPELNFRWAQTQVQDGNLTGAAATLQRILLIQPDLPLIRLFYAVVLMQLGNLVEADRELAQLQAESHADSYAAEIARYRDQIRSSRRRTRHALYLSAGSRRDSNRNFGPASDQILLFDSRIPLGTSAKKSADSAWSSLIKWETRHDLGRHESEELVGDVTYFHSQQDDFDTIDVQALRFDLGVRTRRGDTVLHPALVVDVVDLSRENYVRSVGFELFAERPLAPRLTISGRASLAHEDFDGIPEATTASERSGYRTQLESRLSYTASATQRLDFSAGLTRKSADQTYHAYNGWQLGVTHLWLLPASLFLESSLGFEFEKYAKSQDTISESRRRDFETTGRITLGIPLAAVLGDHAKGLHDVVVSIGAGVELATSNLPNYDYRNRTLTFNLSKRFDF